MAKAALGQDFLIGRVLGHYRIVERIGRGGMGVVYRALDEHLDNREVAIKILPQGSLADETSRLRFRKEAHALSRLNHPNIASVIDFDSCEGIDYLAEEFVAGVSLDEMLATGPLSEKEIVSLGSQLAEGLSAAHDRGIIHRDIKPGNIRVTPEARLKILDFGLAKTLRTAAHIGSESATLSETQIVTGTLPYISPEQLRNEKLDGRTDIWAAGCVLYEMTAGRRPFLGSGPALIDAILHQPLPAITKLNPRISGALEAVIHKCLDKNPERRYHSAREIAVDLARTESAPTRTGVRLRWRRWFTALATAVAVVVVVGAGIIVKSSFQRGATGKQAASLTAQGMAVPHESYLAGLKQLERWDKAGNIDRAIADFQQVIKADPSFALGYSGLAEAYWAKYGWTTTLTGSNRRKRIVGEPLSSIANCLLCTSRWRAYTMARVSTTWRCRKSSRH